ncbi:MAG: cytochrome P450, partial [Oceanicaulis sp.]|nr:cytochrome P450 [Oceanicaulis sp.]
MIRGGHIWNDISNNFIAYFSGSIAYGGVYKWLSPTARRLRSDLKELRAIIRKYVEKNRQDLEKPQKLPNIVAECLQHAVTNSDHIDYDMIQDQAQTFLLAGNETTSAMLTSLFFEFGRDKHILQEAKKEAQSFDPHTAQDSFEFSRNYPFIDCCLKETLRHYPPAYTIDRMLTKDEYFGNDDEKVFLPKGTNCNINIYGAHHDPNVWKNAFEWNPYRWQEEDINRKSRFSYLPFSAGSRDCIGKLLAMSQANIISMTMLKEFDFKFPETFFWKAMRLDAGFVLKPDKVMLHLTLAGTNDNSS